MDMNHKIKILILLLVSLIFLCSCGTDKEVAPPSEISYETGVYDRNIIEEIPYETGTFDWNISEDDTITDTCVPDKETAIKIAEGITSGFQKKGFFPGYVPQHVFFDNKREVWIVSLWEESENENEIHSGACFSVAIRKDNAEVVKMWVGE